MKPAEQHTNRAGGKEEAPGQNKEITIVINGKPKSFIGKEITFEELVVLAFGIFSDNPQTVYTVSYKRGEGNKPEGTMVKGEVVKVKQDMIFNVSATNQS